MDKICELIKQANELIEINNPIELINNLQNTISDQQLEITKLSSSLETIDNKYLEQIKKLNLDLETKTQELKQKNEELKNFAKFSIIQKVNKQLEEKNNYIQILESQLEKNRKNVSPVSPKKQETNDIELTKTIEENIIKEPKEKSGKKKNIIDDEINEEPKEKSGKKKNIIDDEINEEPKEKTGKKKNIIEDDINEEPKEKTGKKKNIIEEFRNDTFNPDNFTEINGYQLMMYKKIYYLRDLETNQLYNIENYKPNIVAGIYTINGKVKLN